MLISGESQGEYTEGQKDAPAAESGNKRRKRTRDKLIRLDDLIPEKDVKGGRQLPFGVTDTTQTTEKQNKNVTDETEKQPRAAVLPTPEPTPSSSNFLGQKMTAPHTRAGMRGGCSPQNNLRKLRAFKRAFANRKKFSLVFSRGDLGIFRESPARLMA